MPYILKVSDNSMKAFTKLDILYIQVELKHQMNFAGNYTTEFDSFVSI